MNFPKMILFDYGQTLVKERKFDGVAGTAAVMAHATKNKYNRTPAEVQAAADAINTELGRLDPAARHMREVEVPNSMFSPYLYESLGIEIALSDSERDKIFWDAASPGETTEGLLEFLDFLKSRGIRTGVISNITYCGEVLKERIDRMVPNHSFEFIIATSQYLFRKPNRHIFELALEKADLCPEDVRYVGDSYLCDVVGAGNAGMVPVWYTGAIDAAEDEKTDVLTVKDWRELEEILLSLK